MRITSYILIVFLVFSSCDKEEETNQNTEAFLGTWELKSFLYQGDIAISIPSKVTIDFSDIFSTNMACPGETGSFETTYYDILSKTEQFTFEDDKLILYFGNSYLSFEKE